MGGLRRFTVTPPLNPLPRGGDSAAEAAVRLTAQSLRSRCFDSVLVQCQGKGSARIRSQLINTQCVLNASVLIPYASRGKEFPIWLSHKAVVTGLSVFRQGNAPAEFHCFKILEPGRVCVTPADSEFWNTKLSTYIQPKAAGYEEVEVFLVFGAVFIPAKIVMMQHIPIDGLIEGEEPWQLFH